MSDGLPRKEVLAAMSRLWSALSKADSLMDGAYYNTRIDIFEKHVPDLVKKVQRHVEDAQRQCAEILSILEPTGDDAA